MIFNLQSFNTTLDSSFVGPGMLACEAGHCFHLLFSFFFLFFFLRLLLSSTSGNLPCVKICFPQYFGITRRYMQKKQFLGNFYFFTKKTDFRAASIRSRSLNQPLVPGVFFFFFYAFCFSPTSEKLL